MTDEKSPEMEAAELEQIRVETEKSRIETEGAREDARKKRIDADYADLTLRKFQRDRSYSESGDEYHRTYYFSSEVTKASVQKAMDVLTRWGRESKAPIIFRITSPGGNVIDGLALYDYLVGLRRHDIHLTTVAVGMAASMGSILLQAGDNRLVGENCHVLIHKVSSVAIGSLDELVDAVEFSKQLNRKLFQILAARSTMSVAQIEKRAERRDWWLDAEETVKLGFADGVESVPEIAQRYA